MEILNLTLFGVCDPILWNHRPLFLSSKKFQFD